MFGSGIKMPPFKTSVVSLKNVLQGSLIILVVLLVIIIRWGWGAANTSISIVVAV